MNISIETVLVITEKLRVKNDSVVTVSVEGSRIYPIGETIPIIARGEGCIGLAKIKQFTVTENKTTVGFSMYDCDENTAEVLYAQYRNKVSSSNYDDEFLEASDDVVIPGMARKARKSTPKPNSGFHW